MNGSLSTILKRSVDDYYTTPENLHCIDTDYYGNDGRFGGYDMERYWKRQKLDQVEQGLCSLRNHAIHTLVKIPRALDKLVTKETAYYGVSQSFDARLFLSHATTDKQLNDYIIDQARKFVEALIFGEEYWILAILPENIAKNLSRERNGYAVTIPVQSVQYVQSSRLLRDYCKRHAYRPWSLESYRFSEGGFRTCHPLAYSRHFTRCNAQYTSSGDLSSLVFKIACYKTYSKNDQQEILNLLLDNKEVQDIISMKIINKSTRR